ncbi:hypothetical protein MKW98_022108, partial [Papaver atlanticum]
CLLSSFLRFISFDYVKSLVPLRMNEEIILNKSEKKKHKRSKEKEALSSPKVPSEKKKKKKKRTELDANIGDVETENNF